MIPSDQRFNGDRSVAPVREGKLTFEKAASPANALRVFERSAFPWQ
jgi:hypothetical protein